MSGKIPLTLIAFYQRLNMEGKNMPGEQLETQVMDAVAKACHIGIRCLIL